MLGVTDTKNQIGLNKLCKGHIIFVCQKQEFQDILCIFEKNKH